ncbi:heparinase [Dysgonomonas sp. HDW5A]|uniref:heparinase II/III domain-containing protein n=1 Tax=Dysgonomonas sp. HDW5A TaxID=2714926 RepID=UPI00140E1E38|nr:heparinase II/III family protein [Dysgonomonas sp. HDW5A]QIK60365.1 heparinase [Dysgonomonas sp. HDW5A]
MKNNKHLIVILLLFLTVNMFAYTEKNLLVKKTDIENLKSMLIMNQQWVPYPQYNDRKGWDNLLGNSKADVIKEGEKYLNYQWQVVKATDYLEYERSGNREIMQSPYNKNNQAIVALLMAELAEGKGRFTDQLINGVFQSCEMTSWVLSAHLTAQHSKRILPDYTEQVIDLGSGNLSSALAWTYYFFNNEFDKVDPAISKRLYYELKKRTLDPYMNEDRFWWMAFNLKPGGMVNNWNPWCNFNVLQCFMLLENDKDKLAKAVYRTMQSVDKFINYTHSDGGCEEGPSYWGHAAGKMYDYLQLLSNVTNGQVSIFDEPIIRNMGEYISRSYVGDGWLVNFADASAKGGGNAQLIYRYGKAVNSTEMMQFAAYLEKQEPSTFKADIDIFRALQTLLYRNELNDQKPMYNTPDYTWYPETEFCYIKDKAGLFLATKGGYNNESHNHNDIGTFSLYMNNTPIIIDAGVGTYTRQTFSNERYSIWTMQSNYHNLPVINEVPQAFGSQYKATNVIFNPKSSTFSADISKAYPETAQVKQWIRSYRLKNGILNIEDSFDLKEAMQNNQVNFLTWGDINIDTLGEVYIHVNGQKAILEYDKKGFTPSIETITLDDPRLSNVWGQKIYRVSLHANNTAKKGKYSFVIKKSNK